MKQNLRGVDLNLLTVFDAIMTEGKLSKAGEKLGMTQPAVSNALARLRVTFKDDLFIRNRQGVTPTPKAHSLYPPIRDALHLIRDTIDTHNEFDPTTSTRSFKLSMSDIGELILMPLLLNASTNLNATVKFEVFPELNNTNFELLKQGLIDFYFDYKDTPDKQLESLRVAEDDAVVIVRKEHPRIKNSISEKQYYAEHHILLNHRHNQKTVLEQLLGKKMQPRKVLAEVSQFTAVPEMITRTDAIAVMPRRIALYYAQLLPIKLLPSPLPFEKLSVFMIWNKALNRDPGHFWLRSLLTGLNEQNIPALSV